MNDSAEGQRFIDEIDTVVERFAAGDVDAFETIFRRHQGEVYGWIVRIVRNPAAAEDLTIETFWRIFQHRKRFDARRPFGPWARRIATRLALDYLRSPEFSADKAQEPVSLPAGPEIARQREVRMHIQRAFGSLPARLRVAAILGLIEERPYSEIAEALDISVSAVKMRIARAVEKLRRALEKGGYRIDGE